MGDAAGSPGDPDPGAPPSAGLQRPTVPQRPGGAPLPAHLPGLTGKMHSGKISTFYLSNKPWQAVIYSDFRIARGRC